MAVVLRLGVLAGSAQTNIFFYSGSETNITLQPGTYIITAYGAPGGYPAYYGGGGAEMSAEFNFTTSTPLTLLVGGGGGTNGGGGAGGISDYEGSYPGPGGGGGSIIDSSAITNLAEISGLASPDDPNNGEIIIIAVSPPLAIITTDAAFGFTNGVFGFNVIGPFGSNVVIQASMDLQTWIPLQTNLLGSGPLYFSDPQSTTNVQRFYRAQFSP